jgi:D-alanyl-D-alanine carboxypeptidase (penicillin-binding protein 5/6)
VRPTGISTPPPEEEKVPRAKAAKRAEADDEETPVPKAKRPRAAAKDEAAPKAKRSRAKTAGVTEPPRVSGAVPNTGAKSVMIIDAHSGQILYEKNADESRAAASTQKLLTALIIAEHGFLDRPVTVELVDTLAEPVKLNIRPGDKYQRIELLRALLVKSPNDVARCLARDHAGSVEAFAAIMNQKAHDLGAIHSHFVNPNGLPVPNQYSTARDLSIIARAAYANPVIRSIVCPSLFFVMPMDGPASSKTRTRF